MYLIIGLLCGFLAGLLGIGGGIVIVPTLSFWFSFQALYSEDSGLVVAVATSLASIIFISSRAAFKHFQAGNVDLDISNRMIWGAFVGSLAAAWLAPSLPSFALKLIVGLFLFLVSLVMFFHWQPNPARHFPNIIGVKDATGNLDRVDQQLSKMGKEFIQMTGNDENAFEFNKRGGVGAISVTANIAPKLCSDFQKFSKSENNDEIKEAERIDKILQPLHHAMFVESNPSPVKYAAKLLNLCDDNVRLPLVKVTAETKDIVKKALHSAKLV